MKVKDVIVRITVGDIAKAREWYTRVFGKRPDLEPFPGNVEFKIGGAWVQLAAGPEGHRGSTVMLGVDDLDMERERLAERGIAAAETQSLPGVIKWFDVADSDGNQMRWFQVLTSDPKVTGVPA